MNHVSSLQPKGHLTWGCCIDPWSIRIQVCSAPATAASKWPAPWAGAIHLYSLSCRRRTLTRHGFLTWQLCGSFVLLFPEGPGSPSFYAERVWKEGRLVKDPQNCSSFSEGAHGNARCADILRRCGVQRKTLEVSLGWNARTFLVGRAAWEAWEKRFAKQRTNLSET